MYTITCTSAKFILLTKQRLHFLNHKLTLCMRYIRLPLENKLRTNIMSLKLSSIFLHISSICIWVTSFNFDAVIITC